MSEPDGTYKVPEDGWVCFHCGERFAPHHWRQARVHFGYRPTATALCQIETEQVWRDLQQYRFLEHKYGHLRDSDIEMRLRSLLDERG